MPSMVQPFTSHHTTSSSATPHSNATCCCSFMVSPLAACCDEVLQGSRDGLPGSAHEVEVRDRDQVLDDEGSYSVYDCGAALLPGPSLRMEVPHRFTNRVPCRILGCERGCKPGSGFDRQSASLPNRAHRDRAPIKGWVIDATQPVKMIRGYLPAALDHRCNRLAVGPEGSPALDFTHDAESPESELVITLGHGISRHFEQPTRP